MTIYGLFIITVPFVLGGLPKGFGEELGWRGFLFPQLYRVMSFTHAFFVTGLIWGMYHLPLILFANYNSSAPKVFAIAIFFVNVIAVGFIYNWMRMKSGSVWTAVLLHATHNIYLQGVFDENVIHTPQTDLIITEFGVGLTIVVVTLAIYFWSRHSELPAPEPVVIEPAIDTVPVAEA